MAQTIGPRWNGYAGNVQVRSGTAAFVSRAKAATLSIDSAASYALKYSSNGTTRTLVDLSLAQTLTNKTLTSPTITGATLSAAIESDIKVLAATATFTSNTVLASLTGFSWTLTAAGIYQFEVELYTTQTTNGGLAAAFKYTTATLTSIQVATYQSTASDNTTAASSQSTTTTDATKFVDNKTAAYTLTRLKGSLVVNVGGSVAVQVAQNTSNSDTTSILLGSFARFSRVVSA